MVAKVS